MIDENIKESDWINVNERKRPQRAKMPHVDELVSRIVGKRIFATDPRLIKLVVKWKGNKPTDSMESDNFLKHSSKIEELKKVLG